MIRSSFNDDWAVRPRVNRHLEIAGIATEWTPVTLPHDAMIGTERSADASAGGGYFVPGEWEYRKTFEVAALDLGSATFVEFEGVYRDALITFNGVAAGHRPYGYSRFLVSIGHLAHAGQNELLVSVRSGNDSRWYGGAGIHRNVSLLTAGSIYLAPHELEVLTPNVEIDGAVVAVAATVRNASTVATRSVLTVELVDVDGNVIASDASHVSTYPGDDIRVRRRLFVSNPNLWGTDTPYLYSCRVTLADADGATIDSDSTTFGIRSISVDPQRGFRLNGETVKLRGACVHHDNGPLGAAAIDRAEARRVELLKAAGFNAIRSAHNPMSTAMLDACDRLGMLVMDETFDMWLQPKTGDDYALRFGDWWEADVEAMVRNDINHPCVVMYCTGNEIPDGSTSMGVRTARQLADKVRSLDPSRLVTQAVSGMMVSGPSLIAEFRKTMAERAVDENTGVNTFATSFADMMAEIMKSPIVSDKTDEAFSHLDVAGYNYMSPRFALDGDEHPHRVIVGSETHPTKIGDEWPMVVNSPHVIGDFTWTGWDYLGEVGIGRVEFADERPERPMKAFGGDFPYLTAWCGDIDITGQRRPQSYYREIVYGLRTDPYIAVARPEHNGRFLAHSSPWSWSDSVSNWSWPGVEGQTVTVEVYADADDVELLVNGQSVGSQPIGSDQSYRSSFDVVYQPGTIEAVARRGGVEVGRTNLSSAAADVQLSAAVERTEISADHSDLAFVRLALVDAVGLVHVDRNCEIAVSVDGPGVLQGLCSANPQSTDNFTGSTCTTFNGSALAVIRPTGVGVITVTALADGLVPAVTAITAMTAITAD